MQKLMLGQQDAFVFAPVFYALMAHWWRLARKASSVQESWPSSWRRT
jgi:hypothetical protein